MPRTNQKQRRACLYGVAVAGLVTWLPGRLYLFMLRGFPTWSSHTARARAQTKHIKRLAKPCQCHRGYVNMCSWIITHFSVILTCYVSMFDLERQLFVQCVNAPPFRILMTSSSSQWLANLAEVTCGYWCYCPLNELMCKLYCMWTRSKRLRSNNLVKVEMLLLSNSNTVW